MISSCLMPINIIDMPSIPGLYLQLRGLPWILDLYIRCLWDSTRMTDFHLKFNMHSTKFSILFRSFPSLVSPPVPTPPSIWLGQKSRSHLSLLSILQNLHQIHQQGRWPLPAKHISPLTPSLHPHCYSASPSLRHLLLGWSGLLASNLSPQSFLHTGVKGNCWKALSPIL